MHVWSTGIGVSATVSNYLAKTLRQLGVPATHLEGGDLAHGDLGGVRKRDLVVFVSASGRTRELRDAEALLKRNVPGVMMAWPFVGCDMSQPPDTGDISRMARRLATRIATKLQAERPEWSHPANQPDVASIGMGAWD